ncbi:MAG: DUF5611 family protein [Euryarchaeota archaeon]|jgi:hypothetical protein|nr:DUF5611 family protein [Euryarchaeota archaeon]
METFEVKRGVVKSVGAEGGLTALGKQYFESVEASGDDSFSGHFGILVKVHAHYDEKGKLSTDVEQMKGSDLEEFLSSDGGREQAMESRRRWSGFLDAATGYSAKQRGDKAKEATKKASKAKSAISQARHFMKMSDVDSEIASQAEELITEIEECLNRGDVTRAASRGEKLGKIF